MIIIQNETIINPVKFKLQKGDHVAVKFDGTFCYAHDSMRTFFEGHLIHEIQ